MQNFSKSEPVSQLKLAMLIDADNTRPAIIEGLLAEVAKYGIASVKRIYGDWTAPNLKQWKESLLLFAIQPIQQFAYTSGKNSTDSALIIDAMDLLYTEKLEGFCIVSSDSDFTRLAARLREAGKLVLGFGERKTPKPFVAACDKFIFTEILRKNEDDAPQNKAEQAKKPSEYRMDKKLQQLLIAAFEDSADDSGWAYLGSVGQYIANRQPEFDPRNFGFRKLADLIKACTWFEVEERSSPVDQGKLIYIKMKR